MGLLSVVGFLCRTRAYFRLVHVQLPDLEGLQGILRGNVFEKNKNILLLQTEVTRARGFSPVVCACFRRLEGVRAFLPPWQRVSTENSLGRALIVTPVYSFPQRTGRPVPPGSVSLGRVPCFLRPRPHGRPLPQRLLQSEKTTQSSQVRGFGPCTHHPPASIKDIHCGRLHFQLGVGSFRRR